jgi:REP-associated tyrosine transposase
VLRGNVQKRCRELINQICDAEDVRILKGGVSKDHIHMHIEYPPKLSVSDPVRGELLEDCRTSFQI